MEIVVLRGNTTLKSEMGALWNFPARNSLRKSSAWHQLVQHVSRPGPPKVTLSRHRPRHQSYMSYSDLKIGLSTTKRVARGVALHNAARSTTVHQADSIEALHDLRSATFWDSCSGVLRIPLYLWATFHCLAIYVPDFFRKSPILWATLHGLASTFRYVPFRTFFANFLGPLGYVPLSAIYVPLRSRRFSGNS